MKVPGSQQQPFKQYLNSQINWTSPNNPASNFSILFQLKNFQDQTIETASSMSHVQTRWPGTSRLSGIRATKTPSFKASIGAINRYNYWRRITILWSTWCHRNLLHSLKRSSLLSCQPLLEAMDQRSLSERIAETSAEFSGKSFAKFALANYSHPEKTTTHHQPQKAEFSVHLHHASLHHTPTMLSVSRFLHM